LESGIWNLKFEISGLSKDAESIANQHDQFNKKEDGPA